MVADIQTDVAVVEAVMSCVFMDDRCTRRAQCGRAQTEFVERTIMLRGWLPRSRVSPCGGCNGEQ